LKKNFILEATNKKIDIKFADSTIPSSDIEYILKKKTSQDSVWQAIPNGLPALHFDLQSNTDYDLSIRYKFQPETINHYLIIVKPYWWQSTFFKILVFFIGLSFLFLSGFYFYNRRRKNQFAKQQEETEKIILNLKAIHSQLNPHFIFNSLSSIQGLINTNRISDANKYLSEFSNLMRNTLIDSDKIYHTLDEEIKVLDTYLKLEQLRFQFEYSFRKEDSISKSEIEIPTFLLQPLVENAVKHGVSGLREKGKINIRFIRDGNNLIAEISDNGKGFKNEKKLNGYGYKLTNDKIELLNKISGKDAIELKILRKNEETVVEIIFKNWL
jgi:two-component sensor histidine kinase